MLKPTKQLSVWKNKFGKEYTDRNPGSLNELERLYRKSYGLTRVELNKLFLGKLNRNVKILEVGSNVGTQLMCLQKMGFRNLYGIEPQSYAVELSKMKTRGINIIEGNAFDLPFKNNYFDLVFTSGVLIHINPKDIKKAIREIYRCSKKYIWGFEYYCREYKNIVYRGNKDLLWKANFSKIYTDTFPDLKVKKIKCVKYSDNDNVDAMFLLRKKHA
jgi:pseudaminic acid biosynthesis-associated methylase